LGFGWLIRFLLWSQIMPQAICTRYGLSVGAKAAPVVRVLLIVFFPVAYPISKVRLLA
jgi:metal transporter CNNM